MSLTSLNHGVTWISSVINEDDSDYPKIIINEEGIFECYYIKDNQIYKSLSTDHGHSWITIGQVGNFEVDTSSNNPFDIDVNGIIYTGLDKELYTYSHDEIGAIIDSIDVSINNRRVVAKVVNTGTKTADFICKINIKEEYPFKILIGNGPILSRLFTCHVRRGSDTTRYIYIKSTESEEIKSKPIFGIGHVIVTVTVEYNGNVISEKTEDGFLFGGRIQLHHAVE